MPKYADYVVFEYPSGGDPEPLAGWDLWVKPDPQPADAPEPSDEAMQSMQHTVDAAAIEAQLRSEFQEHLTAEGRRNYEAGLERGRAEGREQERQAQLAARQQAEAEAEQRRQQQAQQLMDHFSAERDRYLATVEHEVVELALSVAARILRREAQMDPLLLTGAVRVALGQLASSTKVKLKVPAGDLELWTEAIAHLPNLAVKPVVVAGEEMRLGDCVVETELGSVDLGIRSQLGEIERGFFDRARRQHQVETVEVGA